MKKILVLSTILIFSCTKKSTETGTPGDAAGKASYSFSGTLLDCNNQPIVAATIIFDGYNVQTTTTPSGEWNLSAAAVAPCNGVCNLKVNFNGSEAIVVVDSFDSVSTDEVGVTNSVKTGKLILLDPNTGLSPCPETQPATDQPL